MSLFSIPSPVDLVESAINAKLEREVIEGALSAAYSSLITGPVERRQCKDFCILRGGAGASRFSYGALLEPASISD